MSSRPEKDKLAPEDVDAEEQSQSLSLALGTSKDLQVLGFSV